MPQYFFVLGKNPTLSLAEIISVLNKLQIIFDTRILSNEIFVIETHKDLSVEILMSRLGGTIKLGKIIEEVNLDDDEKNFEKIFFADNLLKNYFSKTENKSHFGISIYDGGSDKKYISEITQQLRILNITIKENLKQEGIKAGFIRIKDRYISSVSVAKNKLLTKGVEMVLILTKENILVGKTVAVQEFESFSFRDYGRPQRDTKSGIIPPKLARMMINLASAPKDGKVLDPFCGSGTILQEAIILGYKNIIGTDISNNAVNDSKENIEWLFNNFKQLDKTLYTINIYPTDVKTISQYVKDSSIDVLVTEPYLGPPFYKRPKLSSVMQVFNEVGKLYFDAFSEFHKILKTDGIVVFLFPAFEINGRIHFLEILDKIKKSGFKQLDFFSQDFKKNQTVNLTARNTILYGSPEHFVKREIISWKKI